MTKEEILAMSREENKKADERERDALAKAGQRAVGVGGLVCVAIVILESFLSSEVSFATWAVFLAMAGTQLLVKYHYLKKKHELVFGVLEVLLAIVFLVMYGIRLAR